MQLLPPSKQVRRKLSLAEEGLCDLAFFFLFLFFKIKYHVIELFLGKNKFLPKKTSLKIGDFLSCKFSAFFQLEKKKI
jgi:hypothetical protein